jgi:branched-chain amino acid aminotransferase
MSTPTQAKMGGNYLNSILATQDAKQRGFDEAILLDQSGDTLRLYVDQIGYGNKLCGTISSADCATDWVLTGNTVTTIAKDMGLKSKVRKVSKNELKLADEIFLSGTAAEITPIIQIDKKRIRSSKVGNITKLLMDTYSNIVMNKNKKYSKWLTRVY